MNKIKAFFKKTADKVKENNERSARRQLIEELFQDFHRSRADVYKMNFVRGVFFGFGSVIGGTIVVALLIGILTLLVDLPGGIGDFVQYIVNIVRQNES
ncbi:hypothetical protein CL689_05255 [Candidatus Saccharibacteria bacterium]|nr:hypothetical protein [Candidatus Saccharibacteria bacterium]MBJ58271.1 hypothetical protein [Candidatus Saccharibacteria bacterium]MBQ69450.1 hypothetical protein [Candidatus Saccharibacteria bacterium]|tara:strand:- start:47 stop:343 length:297 start_codon:yes stop_codon:yes gene_type:complete